MTQNVNIVAILLYGYAEKVLNFEYAILSFKKKSGKNPDGVEDATRQRAKQNLQSKGNRIGPIVCSTSKQASKQASKHLYLPLSEKHTIMQKYT